MIVKAIMIPHPPIALAEVGRGEERKMQDTLDAFRTASAEVRDAAPETIIVLSPHAVMYRDYFNISSGSKAYGDMGRFRASRVAFEKNYDTEFTSELTRLLRENDFPGGTEYDREKELDHGTMVPLYFLDQCYTDYRLVRIGLSGLPLPMHYELGQYIAKTAEKLNRRVAVIASGDLAHCQKEDGPYGYRPEGPAYDDRIMKTMGTCRFEELFDYEPVFLDKAMECGHRSFVILAGILDGLAVKAHVLSHEAPFGVGYGIITYDIEGKDDSSRYLDRYEQVQKEKLAETAGKSDIYVKLAREAAAYAVRHNRTMPMPDDLPAELLERRAGCFVSVHEHGDLRGCIGTIAPVRDSLAREIIENAYSAVLRDPRFAPVKEKELPWLEINVDVLEEPERISDRSELDVKKYGIIVSAHGRRGVLLPDLDGVDSVEEQIEIACSKGRIDPDDEDLVIERFEVTRHV